MKGGKAYLNRHLKSMEKSIEDTYHFNNLQHMRPVTRNFPFGGDLVTLNKRKREMIHQGRFNQIERQNKILFQKIAQTMKRNNPHQKKNNRSLNEINRRQQHEKIQAENARFLQRLQNRKPTYDNNQLKKQWEDNKSVIKRLANYNFHLTNINSNVKLSLTQNAFYTQSNFKSNLQKTIKKTLIFDNIEMAITITMNKQMLKIVGIEKQGSTLKVIEIPSKEAYQFLKHQCDDQLHNVFNCLKYDMEAQTLYLVSLHQENPQKPSHVIQREQLAHKYNKLTKVEPKQQEEQLDLGEGVEEIHGDQQEGY